MENDYEVLSRLGEGAFGKVYKARHRRTGDEVAVKQIKIGSRSWEEAMRSTELQALKALRHPFIVRLKELIRSQYDGNLCYIFEFLNSDLCRLIKEHRSGLDEMRAADLSRQLFAGVNHMHTHSFFHRDIKPENIMFDLDRSLPTSPKTVKLIDFDTCLGWAVGTPKSRRFVGTPGYIAPEALLGEIRPQSDLWSIGVILYILMTGEMPWSTLVSLEDGVVGSPGATRMYDALKKEVLDWDKEPWPEFPQARDLCQKLMAFDVDERIGACEEALAHPWLSGS
mmetsp:Transcript_104164/g.164515  ORF Transcript_104164/g.164515 Transcript_104164/m.164515 type:complete len:282 (-) Transcript_104164:135-980(-)